MLDDSIVEPADKKLWADGSLLGYFGGLCCFA